MVHQLRDDETVASLVFITCDNRNTYLRSLRNGTVNTHQEQITDSYIFIYLGGKTHQYRFVGSELEPGDTPFTNIGNQ